MSHDTWIHRLARQCVRPLVHSPVTPDHLTWARMVSGLSAAILLTEANWVIPACLLFLLSMLLDRADGELARMSGRTSARGHRLDLWSDAVCDTAIVLALGFAQRDGLFGNWAIAMGILAALCVALIFSTVLNVDRQLGPGSVVFNAIAGFDPDDFIALVPVSVALGFGDWTLGAALIATPVAAIVVVILLGRQLRGAAAKR